VLKFIACLSLVGSLIVPFGVFADEAMTEKNIKSSSHKSKTESSSHEHMKSTHGHAMKESSDFEPTREAFTENREFLVRLVGLPNTIPLKKHFSVAFEVYNGRSISQKVQDAKLQVEIGMRHGMKDKFAHGMNSEPEVVSGPLVTSVDGVYFHMAGKWTIGVSVKAGKRVGTAWFDLPCCSKE